MFGGEFLNQQFSQQLSGRGVWPGERRMFGAQDSSSQVRGVGCQSQLTVRDHGPALEIRPRLDGSLGNHECLLLQVKSQW